MSAEREGRTVFKILGVLGVLIGILSGSIAVYEFFFKEDPEPSPVEPGFHPRPLQVVAFAAKPAQVPPGQPVTLEWTVTGADTVSIDGGVGPVSLTGSRTIVPTESVTYELTASASGKTARALAPVDVKAEVRTYSEGEGCMRVNSAFDLDTGSWGAEVARLVDLHFDNHTEDEKRLRGSNGGAIARTDENFETLRPEAIEAQLRQGSRAMLVGRWDSPGDLVPGTVLAVRTDEGRFAKVQVKEYGLYLRFRWVTYAKPGEARSTRASKKGFCSCDEEHSEGRQRGERIVSFDVVGRDSASVTVDVHCSFSSSRTGRVILAGYLVNEFGMSLNSGFKIAIARSNGPSRTTITVPDELRQRGVWSDQLQFQLYEVVEKGEAREFTYFLCAEFPYREYFSLR